MVERRGGPSWLRDDDDDDVYTICSSCKKSMVSITDKKAELPKDDRAMRPIYGCPENFPESLGTPTATFLDILMGFCGVQFRIHQSHLKSFQVMLQLAVY